MPARFVSGDIFSTPPEVALAHGCNCAGAMGKGIAVEFKRRWPQMYEQYKLLCKAGEFVCGEVFRWTDPATGRVIFNLGIQRTWRTKATKEAVAASLSQMIAIADGDGIRTARLPMIGAGLGGLNADDVKEMLVEYSRDSAVVELVICEEFAAGKAPLTD